MLSLKRGFCSSSGMAPITTGVEQKCASTAKLAALQVSKLASEKDVTVIVPDGGSIDPRVCFYIFSTKDKFIL